MSLVKSHDIIQTNLHMTSSKNVIKKLEDGKHEWNELSSSDRERIVSNLHKNEINAIRQQSNLSIDHQKMIRSEFTETWIGSLGTYDEIKLRQQELKRMKKPKDRTMYVFGTNDDEDDSSDVTKHIDFLGIELIPGDLSGFNAMKNKYQYFKVNKMSVRFVANTASNLSPIVCRYIPPVAKYANLDDMNKDVESDKLNLDYITKYSESAGTNYGYVSIHCPPCLIKIGQYTKEGFIYGDTGMCLANLCTDRIITDYKDFNQQIDFGTFIFESRNMNYQSVIAQISYQIDFYTGIDYEAAALPDLEPNPEPDDDDNDDDNGQVTPPRGKSSGGLTKKKFTK